MNKKLGALLAILAYAAALALFGVLWWPTVKASSLSDEKRQLNLDSFDLVWKTVAENHFDPALNGIDWDAAGEELRPRMEQARTADRARRVLKDLLSRLGQSHYVIVPAEAYDQAQAASETTVEYGTAGIDLRIIDGQAIVTSTASGSPAAEADVRPGWQVVRIGEAKATELISAAERDLTGRSWQRAGMTEAVLRRLSGRMGSEIAIDFRDADDQRVWHRIPVVEPLGERYAIGNAPPTYVWIESDYLEESFGYLAFNFFAHPNYVMKTFNEAMLAYSDAQGIVIDLRGNGGGMAEMVTGMMGWFVNVNHHVGTQYFREGELKFLARPRLHSYRGPVAVLVDELCGSGSELFASGLQDLGRAVIIGSPTSGSVLGSSFVRLPNGDGFQYVISNYISAITDEPIEGRGVQPDIKVSPSREALLDGRDLVLEAALEWIGEQPTAWRSEVPQTPSSIATRKPLLRKIDQEFDPEAIAVLDSFVSAVGGEEAYAKLQNRRTRATVRIADHPIEIRLLEYRARPNRTYSFFESEVMGNIESGVNGSVAWSLDLMRGPQLKTGSERGFELRAAWFDGEIQWRKGFQAATYNSTVDLDGTMCHKIALTAPGGGSETRFYDISSSLLVKTEIVLELPEGQVTMEISHDDYRRVDGLQLAHQVGISVLGQERTLAIESIEHNVELPERIFEPPAEILQLAGATNADSSPG